MKKIVLVVALCFALAGCSGTKTSANKPHDGKPVESLLTAKDMAACEQQLGVTPPKGASDIYALSADSINRVKDCAYGMEKQRMPLLSDLIDKYKQMLQQENSECDKDIGTHYAEVCMKKSLNDANDWYNLAVSQRLLNAMPNQPQTQGKPASP